MHASDKDLELIDLLRHDARMSVTDIADRLGVSRSTAQKRLELLKKRGVIASYTVVLSEAFLKSQVRAHVSFVVTPNKTLSVIDAMKKIRAVEEIHSVSGDSDLVAELSAPNVSALDDAIEVLIGIDGVERTRTSVILSTKFKR